MNFGTYSTKERKNRIYEESRNKDYNMNFGRLNNSKYQKNSDGKIIVTLLTAGILTFYIYKNVIKPAGKLIKKIIDIIEPNPEENSRVMKEDDRVFDGKIRVLSKAEQESLRNDDTNIILKPDEYVISEND